MSEHKFSVGDVVHTRDGKLQGRVICDDRRNAHGEPLIVLLHENGDSHEVMFMLNASGRQYPTLENPKDILPGPLPLVVTPGRYETRGGEFATVWADDMDLPYPCLGRIDGTKVLRSWSASGYLYSDHRSAAADLVRRLP